MYLGESWSHWLGAKETTFSTWESAKKIHTFNSRLVLPQAVSPFFVFVCVKLWWTGEPALSSCVFRMHPRPRPIRSYHSVPSFALSMPIVSNQFFVGTWSWKRQETHVATFLPLFLDFDPQWTGNLGNLGNLQKNALRTSSVASNFCPQCDRFHPISLALQQEFCPVRLKKN